MIRFASVRYDGVLGLDERDEAVRALGSTGADVTSWNAAAGRTYARIRFDPNRAEPALAMLRGRARVDVPPLGVFRIVPVDRSRLPALLEALGGPGRPAGVVDARPDGAEAVVVEVECSRTPPALLLALVDAELSATPGRRVDPLLGLEDDVLAAFAGAVLREPELDATRLIETYLEPLTLPARP